MENPHAGIVEADEIDHARILEIARPYLGEVAGVYSDWTPLWNRGALFPRKQTRVARGSSGISGWRRTRGVPVLYVPIARGGRF
jgi:hypothetical protein